MSLNSCCLEGEEWQGVSQGREDKIGGLDSYVTGDNSRTAVLVIHDLFGWKFPNIRLLADHYAKGIDATVYVPDFFGGEVLDWDTILSGDFTKLDLPNFMKRNGRHVREPEILQIARILRSKFDRVCAIGFCYGGWAVFHLGSRQHQPALVDCMVAGHPSFLTQEDIDDVRVPVQILAPEFDQMYTAELKLHTFHALPKLGLPFDYRHFPKVGHGCLIRGSRKLEGEQDAIIQGRKAAIHWCSTFLR